MSNNGADPTGDWHSTLERGPVSMRIALHLADDASSIDSVDQGVFGLPAQLVRDGGHVIVTVDKFGQFEADLSADGQTLDGVLKQGAATTPMVFQRGVIAAARRPQTPTKPYPYAEIDAAYDNPADPAVHLTGTLTVPVGAGPFPAVILITGSGAHDRDETMFEHKPFLVAADYLTRRGVAVLRVDDRGTGGSTGAAADNTTLDFATDVAASLAWLKSRAEVDPARIGLIGHSEGGIIAPLLAWRDPAVAFVVLWAGPGVSGAEVIVEQVRAMTLASGASAAVAEQNSNTQARLLAVVMGAADGPSARAAVIKAVADAGAPAIPDVALGQLTSAWYRNFLVYDPAPALRALKIPVLALLGGKDTQVTVAQNLQPIRAALAGNDKAKVEVLADLNHMFQTATSGGVDEYGKIDETVAPAALKAMGDWIVGVVGPPAH